MSVASFNQEGYGVRFGWGPEGLQSLAPVADVVVIVDVLSFSTAVDVALGRGVAVFPYQWHDGTEYQFAAEMDATVASRRGEPVSKVVPELSGHQLIDAAT